MKRASMLLLFAALASFASLPAQAQTVTRCLAHLPQYIEDQFEVNYSNGCTGHDEPELDPVSSAAGSARDLTWTVVLPTSGTSSLVSNVGPTFWFGGTVNDPKSVFGQAFLELQFYPDSQVVKCFNNGAFAVNYAPNTYTACSPVWKIVPTGNAGIFNETAAFNAMLEDSANPGSPLVMHAGDVVTVHFYVTPAADGFHMTVTDVNSGYNGTIVLNNPAEGGPLMPSFDTQQLGNALSWGGVYDTPNSFVWEIGHAPLFTYGAQYCVPGQTICDSYNSASWAGFSPIQIKSVTFGDGSAPKSWAVVSNQGGKAEVAKSCSAYGGAFCIYPWYSLGATGLHYGIDYPDTLRDFGQANQFQQTRQCGGPFGPDSTYCTTTILH